MTFGNPKTANTVWHPSAVARSDRWQATGGGSDAGAGGGFGGVTVWLTGLSGSGKSSVAVELERQLIEAGRPAYLLDGDNLRQGLNGDLGFSAEDRDENVRRVGHVARLFCDAGLVAIVVDPFLIFTLGLGLDGAAWGIVIWLVPIRQIDVGCKHDVFGARDRVSAPVFDLGDCKSRERTNQTARGE